MDVKTNANNENGIGIQTERPSRRRTQELHLDRIVASQPEIGPTPPDGGYGWVILVSATIFNITVPGLLIMYSFVILKALKQEDHDDDWRIRIWDVGIALVPVLAVVIRLLLESWCRTVVKLFHMPRLLALAGLCPTVAGILLSSYNTNPEDNDDILNIFSGILIGVGWALTSQQTDVIITHYFRDKLTIAQRIVKLAPSIGNCIVPIIVGILCIKNTSDVAVMIYAAILMQNCFFLASYSRPIYIERVLKSTYNMLKDDDDDIIFSRPTPKTNTQNQQSTSSNTQNRENSHHVNQIVTDDGDDHVIVFNKNKNAKEIIDPAVQLRESMAKIDVEHRFSSDFATVYNDSDVDPTRTNRFSSDFSGIDVQNYGPSPSTTTGYQELETIDRAAANPQPLYRETTVNTGSQYSLGFVVEPNPTIGTQRRTASLKKYFITVTNMLIDINFYMYALLHLSSTFSTLVMAIYFAPLVWQENPSLNIWDISILFAVVSVVALFFMKMSAVFSQSVNDKYGVCGLLCALGAIGCYGLCFSSGEVLMSVYGIFAAYSAGAISVLRKPVYSALNEFDATATVAIADTMVAAFIMIWAVVRNYELSTCFLTAGQLQTAAGLACLAASFRRYRK